jgi:hypothetical protein
MSASPAPRRYSDESQAAHTKSTGYFKPYRLKLHRGHTDTLWGIVECVRKLVHFAEAEAMCRMWDMQILGSADVVCTYYERAEFLMARFQEHGIQATLEAA